MRADAIPVIRLEIDHMKHAIAAALGIEGSDLEDVINREIENQLGLLITSEIPRLVKDTIMGCVQSEVKSYFTCGDGAKAIEEAVKTNFKIN